MFYCCPHPSLSLAAGCQRMRISWGGQHYRERLRGHCAPPNTPCFSVPSSTFSLSSHQLAGELLPHCIDHATEVQQKQNHTPEDPQQVSSSPAPGPGAQEAPPALRPPPCTVTFSRALCLIPAAKALWEHYYIVDRSVGKHMNLGGRWGSEGGRNLPPQNMPP